MLTEEEHVEAAALHRRGWSTAAIARHLGRDRKTTRADLRGERSTGKRRRAVHDQTVREWLKRPELDAVVRQVREETLEPTVGGVLRLGAVTRDGRPDHATRLRAASLLLQNPDAGEPARGGLHAARGRRPRLPGCARARRRGRRCRPLTPPVAKSIYVSSREDGASAILGEAGSLVASREPGELSRA